MGYIVLHLMDQPDNKFSLVFYLKTVSRFFSNSIFWGEKKLLLAITGNCSRFRETTKLPIKMGVGKPERILNKIQRYFGPLLIIDLLLFAPISFALQGSQKDSRIKIIKKRWKGTIKRSRKCNVCLWLVVNYLNLPAPRLIKALIFGYVLKALGLFRHGTPEFLLIITEIPKPVFQQQKFSGSNAYFCIDYQIALSSPHSWNGITYFSAFFCCCATWHNSS